MVAMTHDDRDRRPNPHGVERRIIQQDANGEARAVSTVTTRFLGTFRDSVEDQMRFVTLVRGAAAAS